MMVRGKLYEARIVEGFTKQAHFPYRYAEALVKDDELGELILISAKLKDGESSPFEAFQKGQHVELPARNVRIFNKQTQADYEWPATNGDAHEPEVHAIDSAGRPVE